MSSVARGIFCLPYMPFSVPMKLTSPPADTSAFFRMLSGIMCSTVSSEGVCSPYCKSTSSAWAAVSRRTVPFTPNFVPLMSIMASCRSRECRAVFSSRSVRRWVAMRFANNCPSCQKRRFLLRKSTASMEWPFFILAFRVRSVSHRLAKMRVSRSSMVTVACWMEICRMSSSLMFMASPAGEEADCTVSGTVMSQLAMPSLFL